MRQGRARGGAGTGRGKARAGPGGPGREGQRRPERGDSTGQGRAGQGIGQGRAGLGSQVINLEVRFFIAQFSPKP